MVFMDTLFFYNRKHLNFLNTFNFSGGTGKKTHTAGTFEDFSKPGTGAAHLSVTFEKGNNRDRFSKISIYTRLDFIVTLFF